MQVLNKSDYSQECCNSSFEISKFSSGEWNVCLAERLTKGVEYIKWNWFENKDVMLPILMANCIKSVYGSSIKIVLLMEYAPYSRQDRVFEGGNCIPYDVLLNTLKPHFNYIDTFCLHNKNFGGYENNLSLMDEYYIEGNYKPYINDTVIVFPDASACKHLNNYINIPNQITLKKSRSQNSISSIIDETRSTVDLSKGYKKFLIIDDICAGGRTFINAANILKENFGEDIDIALVVNTAFLDYGIDGLKESGISKVIINSEDSYNNMLSLYLNDCNYFSND